MPDKSNEQPCCAPTPPSKSDGCCAGPDHVNSAVQSNHKPAAAERERPGYRICSFVSGWLDSAAGEVPQVTTHLDRADLLGRWQMRWGIGRTKYRIAPGLYAVGCPDAQSPVVVTANYKMSFDALRSELSGRHLWILVLETYGINVWCAAGKATFGTDEVVRRINASGLEKVVNHRHLILPQLGAVGVAAHEVRKKSGFQVSYGPVRARDLPAYLDGGEKAMTPQMRRVSFPLAERLALTPVELVGMGKVILWSIVILLVLGGIGPWIFSLSAALNRGSAAILSCFVGLLGGAVITPALLPWLPWRPFAAKGALVGGLLALIPIILYTSSGWLTHLALILALTAISSYCAMNFTGSTTFTSPSGVEKEMRWAIPFQAGALLLAGIFWVLSAFIA